MKINFLLEMVDDFEDRLIRMEEGVIGDKPRLSMFVSDSQAEMMVKQKRRVLAIPQTFELVSNLTSEFKFEYPE